MVYIKGNALYLEEPDGWTDSITDEEFALWGASIDNYKVEDGVFVKLKTEEELKAELLRKRRESECFPVINRGTLWYEKLTAEQKMELSTWYEAWLDAPATGTAPTAPIWLNEVAGQAKTI